MRERWSTRRYVCSTNREVEITENQNIPSYNPNPNKYSALADPPTNHSFRQASTCSHFWFAPRHSRTTCCFHGAVQGWYLLPDVATPAETFRLLCIITSEYCHKINVAETTFQHNTEISVAPYLDILLLWLSISVPSVWLSCWLRGRTWG